jgi:hypothetical protein
MTDFPNLIPFSYHSFLFVWKNVMTLSSCSSMTWYHLHLIRQKGVHIQSLFKKFSEQLNKMQYMPHALYYTLPLQNSPRLQYTMIQMTVQFLQAVCCDSEQPQVSFPTHVLFSFLFPLLIHINVNVLLSQHPISGTWRGLLETDKGHRMVLTAQEFCFSQETSGQSAMCTASLIWQRNQLCSHKNSGHIFCLFLIDVTK